jgi:acetyl-CoA synthetase
MSAAIEHLLEEERVFMASATFKESARVRDHVLYELAGKDFRTYWEREARELCWFEQWERVLDWQPPHVQWFVGGKTNISYNCLDRHMPEKKDKVALHWQGEGQEKRALTYGELLDKVQKCANGLKRLGIKKGDTVAIYMPMIPEAVVAMQACARIGAIHTVVFAGFSSQALADRIQDAGCKIVLTANSYYRKGQLLCIKEKVDDAVAQCPSVEYVVVVSQETDQCTMLDRDIRYHDLLVQADSLCAPEPMDAEDPLFILYTSGTTGKPKGVLHTVGGYMVGAYATTKYVFDVKDSDIFWCTADVGWITGHTYVAYGPLLNGMTQLMYEGALHHPHKGRTWELIEQYRVTTLYTAPTAIRMFSVWGQEIPYQYDMSSLRLLGSVGEPLNPEAWMWYYEHIGNSRCPIVDTWWQTETGSIMITSLPGVESMKPGFAGKPLPGVVVRLVDDGGNPIKTGSGLLTITKPWPSMARTIWKDDVRFKETYFRSPDYNVYYCGDAAARDEQGNIMIIGRIDDVINVSGHRIGAAEIESALIDHHAVAEVAVVPRPHAITGQEIVAFVILKEQQQQDETLQKILQQHVVGVIGAIARPGKIVFVPDLPKTRSGKIMRRLLRELVEGLPLSDTTTLADPDIMQVIAECNNTI